MELGIWQILKQEGCQSSEAWSVHATRGRCFPMLGPGTWPLSPTKLKNIVLQGPQGSPQTLWGSGNLHWPSAVFSLPTPQPDKRGYGELGNCRCQVEIWTATCDFLLCQNFFQLWGPAHTVFRGLPAGSFSWERKVGFQSCRPLRSEDPVRSEVSKLEYARLSVGGTERKYSNFYWCSYI